MDSFVYLLIFNYGIPCASVIRNLLYDMVYTYPDISLAICVTICFMGYFCKGSLDAMKWI